MRASVATVSAIALFTIAGLASGCQVNKLGEYRHAIDSFEAQTVVSGALELQIDEIPDFNGDGVISPSEAANNATESYIIEGLRNRLSRAADRERLSNSMNGPMAEEVSRGTQWRLMPQGRDADMELVTLVEGYGLHIDAIGRATIYFRLTIKGWHTGTDQLIYQQFSSYEVPLLDRTFGGYDPAVALANDPVRFAAERATNLLMINDMSTIELHDRILFAATDAGLELATTLIRDAY